MSGVPAIERLGLEIERAIARRGETRRRWLRLPRALPLVFAAVLLTVAVATAATSLFREGAPVPVEKPSGTPARSLPLEPLRAADPLGGLAWAIRLAVAGPLVCQSVGQVVRGQIGVIRGRTFHALPAHYRDSCARVPADGAVVRWGQYPGPNVGTRGARTVVHGVAGREVAQLAVVAGAITRRLPISDRGAFVSAFAGLQSASQLRVEVTLSDGTTRSYPRVAP